MRAGITASRAKGWWRDGAGAQAYGEEPLEVIGVGVGTAAIANTPPRVSGWPVVGPVLEVHQDLLGLYERAHRECGDIARLVLGVPPLRKVLHLVMHPEGVQHVLATQASSYGKDNPAYEEVRAYFGRGLLTSQDQEWERQKRMIQPLFTPRRVATYAGVMAEEAETVVASWRQAAALGRPVDLHEASFSYTLRVIGRALFGDALDDVVARSADRIQHHVLFRTLSPVRLPRHWPTPRARAADRHRQALYRAVDTIIARADRREHGDEPGDLVSLLLAAPDPVDGSALSHQEVRDQNLGVPARRARDHRERTHLHLPPPRPARRRAGGRTARGERGDKPRSGSPLHPTSGPRGDAALPAGMPPLARRPTRRRDPRFARAPR